MFSAMVFMVLTAIEESLQCFESGSRKSRLQSILDATEAGQVLPPVELYRLCDRYYVLDGHHRVAAALKTGQLAMDAHVVEFRPGEDGCGFRPFGGNLPQPSGGGFQSLQGRSNERLSRPFYKH
jgi:hypothetical protein